MERYSEYKDSGVEWIGEKPSGWLTSKFKFITSLQTGNSLNDEMKKLYESNNKEDIPYVSSKDINVEYKTVNYNNGLRIPKETNPLKVSAKGSFLLCVEGGSAGKKMVFLKEDVCFVNKLCSFKSKQNTKYQFYFIQSSQYQSKFKSALTGLIGGVSISSLRDFELLLPPLQEQEQIVVFLDEKVAKIDDLLAKTKQKIDLLKEKRTALINHCVTKGLNPNATMKDSGVEWIGEIPSGWETSKVKFITSVISKGTTPSTIGREVSDIGDVKFLKAENIFKNKVVDTPKYFIDYETHNLLKRSILKEGDLLFVIAGATIGKVAILDKKNIPSNTNQAVSFLRLKREENNRFLWYWLTSGIINEQIWLDAVQSAQPNLSMEDLGNFDIPYPSLREQQQIVAYLDEQTSKIDKSISIEQKRIELLKEYRQSIISNVVTGKIKVCNFYDK